MDPLLGRDLETNNEYSRCYGTGEYATTVSEQRLGKQVSTQTNMRATTYATEQRMRGRSFYVGATFVAPQFQHEYISAVTATRSVWTLCIHFRCTVKNIGYFILTRDGSQRKNRRRSILLLLRVHSLRGNALIMTFPSNNRGGDTHTDTQPAR
jgi:hypothetical protein